MIQRIQSVYLLLVSGLMLMGTFLPAALTGEIGGETIMNVRLTTECVLTAILALAAVFMYKNRKQQLTVCFAILGILALSYLILLFDFWLPNRDTIQFQFHVSIVFSFFAIVLDVLAIFAIQKDEKLVHATDRLR